MPFRTMRCLTSYLRFRENCPCKQSAWFWAYRRATGRNYANGSTLDSPPRSPQILAPEYHEKISEYGRSLIEEKRKRRGDDILSNVIHAKADDGSARGLSDAELLGFFQLLFPAGAETTRSAIGGGLLALLENPDQLAALRDDPKLLNSAIEEIVRWTTPSIYKRRTATKDVEFKGRQIKAGDKVTFWEMSANRDERVFRDPFQFDIRRMPNPHLGFGYGVHVCLGSMLARMERKSHSRRFAQG